LLRLHAPRRGVIMERQACQEGAMTIQWSKLIVSLLLPQLAGLFGAIFTARGVREWYPLLQKPSFTPPSWLFGPVWLTLYLLMGVALYRVWVHGAHTRDGRWALAFFALQLLVNALWSYLFFGLRNPALGLAGIFLLWLLIVMTLVLFAKVDRPATLLLIPYLLWVSFAMALNYAIWSLNRG
jgi:benzodiazapine receptor